MKNSDQISIFLDANVLFSAAYRTPNTFERLWTRVDVRLLTSGYCLVEVRRNLPTTKHHLLDALLRQVIVVEDCPEHLLPRSVMLPSKDLPVLAAAMLCEADILLTGDQKHFGPFYGTKQGSVRVESPRGFWDRFDGHTLR